MIFLAFRKGSSLRANFRAVTFVYHRIFKSLAKFEFLAHTTNKIHFGSSPFFLQNTGGRTVFLI